MNYHLALRRNIDFDKFEQDAQSGQCPRHIMVDIRKRLNAKVHSSNKLKVRFVDKILSKISSRPEH